MRMVEIGVFSPVPRLVVRNGALNQDYFSSSGGFPGVKRGFSGRKKGGAPNLFGGPGLDPGVPPVFSGGLISADLGNIVKPRALAAKATLGSKGVPGVPFPPGSIFGPGIGG